MLEEFIVLVDILLRLATVLLISMPPILWAFGALRGIIVLRVWVGTFFFMYVLPFLLVLKAL